MSDDVNPDEAQEMAPIPPNAYKPEDLAEWFNMQKQLAILRVGEMLLRKKIFAHFFPAPTEGTNTVPLPENWQLKGGYVINRKIVPESMAALCYREPLPEGGFAANKLEQIGISTDRLIKWTPELSIKVYRELNEAQQHLVDQMLLIEPGAPSLEIAPPAKRRGGAK